MNTTIENNKIIAEFMGVSKSKIDANGQVLNFENSKYNTYNSDWNWLMEVVEKIETTSYNITQTKPYLNNKDRFKGTTSLSGEFIIGYDDREDFKGWTSYVGLGTLPSIIIKDFGNRFNTKIEAVYNACVEFIKWYNEQNKV